MADQQGLSAEPWLKRLTNMAECAHFDGTCIVSVADLRAAVLALLNAARTDQKPAVGKVEAGDLEWVTTFLNRERLDPGDSALPQGKGYARAFNARIDRILAALSKPEDGGQ